MNYLDLPRLSKRVMRLVQYLGVPTMMHAHAKHECERVIIMFIPFAGRDGSFHCYSFLQYQFTGGERKIKVKEHGNATKGSRPFKPTATSTMVRLKELVRTSTPKVAVNRLLEEGGGIENVRSSADIARDRQQAANFRRDVKEKENKVASCSDPLLTVMDRCKQEQRDSKCTFIREVSSAPEMLVVLANNFQLAEVKRFCTNPASFSVFGVDVTFNVGEYYVCLTTYRDLMLKTKSGVHPVMLGPILLHQRKLFSSYYTLPSTMIRYDPDLQGILAFGTDGELALSKAFESAFPFAVHLLCDMHMEDTIISKLKDLGIRGLEAKQYMADIFGDKSDPSSQSLVSSNSSEHFRDRLLCLKDVWISRHKEGEKFYKYFAQKKADQFANCMTAEVRSLSGLGYPPDIYTQNANECMNAVIKRAQNKKMDVVDCIENLRNEVNHQQSMKKLAMVSRGELSVFEKFGSFLIDEDEYFRMSKQQQESAFKKFCNAPLDESEDAACQAEESQITQDTPLKNLSVQTSQACITSIPSAILTEIFVEANRVLEDECGIHKFGQDNSYYVEDSTRKGCALHVTIRGRGDVSCEPSCLRWSSYKLCAHTIAAAEKEGVLMGFIKKYAKSSREPNLTSLATHDMPKGRGKKATKATQRRKGSANGAVRTVPK